MLKERSSAQEHCIDICRLISRPTPAEAEAAAFDANDWPHDLADEEILERLLSLNLERAAAQ